MPEHYDLVREDVILHELSSNGQVSVTDLATRLGVSAVTIRKDLDSLERRSLLHRVRGGAVASPAGEEGAFSERLRKESSIKRELGREAATLVNDGDVIAIDSSTTCYFLAEELVDRRNLVVVTNGMRTATLFMNHSNATVVMPGGMLRRASGSMVGAFSNVLEGRGRIRKGFFGVAALSRGLGLLELSTEEAETKKSLIRACDVIYGLLASSKIDGFGLHSFAVPDEITGLFTDEGAGEEFVSGWASIGVPVTRVAGTGDLLETERRAIEELSQLVPG